MSEMSLSDVVPGLQPAPPTGRRSAARARERRKRRRRRRAVVAVLLSVVVIGGGVAAAWAGLAPLVQRLREPSDYTGQGTGDVKVKIASGSSGVTIGRVLAAADVVKTQRAFVEAVQNDPQRASRIQPGTYQLRHRMSAAAALALLLDPTSRLILTVTVPEGKRVPQVLALLADKLDLDQEALAAASKDPRAIGLPGAAAGNPEGFLYPATYDFEPDVTAQQVLARMVAHGRQEYARLGVPEASLRAVIIKASLVQAEAGQQRYMGPVARVIENRLKINKNLELDSTVSYAVGRFGVTTTAAERAVKSPYNTYNRQGLPIGPIDSPGAEAIQAVLHPTPGTWLYFTTVNPTTGETKFATTPEQKAAIDREWQAWLRAHPQG